MARGKDHAWCDTCPPRHASVRSDSQDKGQVNYAKKTLFNMLHHLRVRESLHEMFDKTELWTPCILALHDTDKTLDKVILLQTHPCAVDSRRNINSRDVAKALVVCSKVITFMQDPEGKKPTDVSDSPLMKWIEPQYGGDKDKLAGDQFLDAAVLLRRRRSNPGG